VAVLAAAVMIIITENFRIVNDKKNIIISAMKVITNYKSQVLTKKWLLVSMMLPTKQAY
jgi:hypothetical protein